MIDQNNYEMSEIEGARTELISMVAGYPKGDESQIDKAEKDRRREKLKRLITMTSENDDTASEEQKKIQ